MPWDAGSIRGRLELETKEFTDNFQKAREAAIEHAAHINEGCLKIAESLEEVVGPALSNFTRGIASALQGFDQNGAVVGGIGALTLGMGALKEATEATAERWDRMGIESTKLGIPVEYLSRLSVAAKTVDVDTQQLSQAFVLMNQRIGEIAEGTDKKAVEAFGKLKISMADLRDHGNDATWVIDSIIDRMDLLKTAGDRTDTLKNILGRGGANLIPLFSMGGDEIGKIEEIAERLGGTINARDAEMGESFHKLTVYAEAAMDGVEAAFSRPALKYLSDHLDEVVAKLQKVQGVAIDIAKDSPEAADWLDSATRGLKDAGNFIASIPGVSALWKASMTPLNMTLDEAETFRVGEKKAHALHLDDDIKWRVGAPGTVPGVYLPSPASDFAPIHHPDQSAMLGTPWPAYDPYLKVGQPPQSATGQGNAKPSLAERQAGFAWESFEKRMNYFEQRADLYGDTRAGDNLFNQQFRADANREDDRRHGIFTNYPPAISFDADVFKNAIWQGFTSAMDSHANSHATSSVDDVLRSVVNDHQQSSGGSGAGGVTSGSSTSGAPTYNVTVQVTANLDGSDAAKQITNKMLQPLREKLRNLDNAIYGNRQVHAASQSIGGSGGEF